MLNRLVELSLRYKFLVLIVFAVVAFLGISAVRNVPIDAFPDVTPVQVNIYTESPGRQCPGRVAHRRTGMASRVRAWP